MIGGLSLENVMHRRSSDKGGWTAFGNIWSADSYPLLRYYLVTSLIVITVVTIAVAVLFVRRAETDFAVKSAERGAAETAHLAQILYFSIWAPAAEIRDDVTLRQAIDPEALTALARGTKFGLNMISVNILDLDGIALWSSDPYTLWERALDMGPYETAAEFGVYTSSLQRDVVPPRTDDLRQSIDVVRTFYPLKDVPLDSGREGKVVGVIETVKDVTDDRASTREETLIVATLGSIGSGAVLFALLFLIVFRADRMITRGRSSLLAKQRELEDAHAKQILSGRLAAVGELVSGVAHELNNPLTSIWGLSQLLISKSTDPSDQKELVTIGSEAERSVHIVQNLLAFARGGSNLKSYVAINEAVEAVVDLRGYGLRQQSVDLVVNLEPDLPMTMADPHKMQQVVLNLISNAEQAMADAKVGDRLLVKTERTGDVIRIVVADNGPGIPGEHVERIFDPFFTTKDVGKGTGLGLSICYGIVKEHGGQLRVRNGSPRGAVFIVELPIASPEESKRNGAVS